MMLDPSAFSWLADAADVAGEAAGAAADAAQGDWFDLILVKPFEFGITALHELLQGLGVQNSYGPAIILFTIGVKALTFPLTKQQIESTTKMQAIAPAAKALQEKYRDRDPARLNQELQKLYTENSVNPLAGCLPALAQIPLFIGLYRSLLNLAKADALAEPFLWLPSLEGPVADYQEGIGWLTEWVNGAPKFGWSDTIAYLVLPILLVISQYASTALLTPKTDDPAQQQSQAILKFLPLMIGWFSLNVPSGLGLYWLTNNFLTTASTLWIRNGVAPLDLAGAGGGGATVAAEPPKPQGFGRRYGEVVETTSTSDSGTKITIKPPKSKESRAERRAAEAEPMTVEATAAPTADAVANGEAIDAHAETEEAPAPAPAPEPVAQKKGGRKKKRAGKKN